MTFLDEVAEAPNPREALLRIAAALDVIYAALPQPPDPSVANVDAWEAAWYAPGDNVVSMAGWNHDSPLTPPAEVQMAMHKEGTDYVIPPPPPQLKAERAQFIENFRIPEGDAYVKGGPEWLTAYDTEFVMSLPAEARQIMARDYEQRGLTQEAREFAVAFLKGEASNMATAVPLADTLNVPHD